MDIINLKIEQEIYRSNTTQIVQGFDPVSQKKIIVKSAELSSIKSHSIRSEYQVTEKLNIGGLPKSISLSQHDNRVVYIREFYEGHNLGQYMDLYQPNVTQSLKIALQLAHTLGLIHEKGVIHKDICPDNILVDLTGTRPIIIDFDQATKYKINEAQVKEAKHMQGRLLFISPEQTGRTNKSLDYRTDLYSLGATFYYLFSGKYPFYSEDPLELIHAHIAKSPEAPSVYNTEIPEVLDRIVLKLLAKNVEDRYQSAFGLRHDLEKVSLLIELNRMELFPLGEKDYSGKFSVTEKTFGREQEIHQLNEALQQVRQQNTKTMVHVVGESGVGKTALIKEFLSKVDVRSSVVLTAEFKQNHRNVPFSGWTKIFDGLVDQILTLSSEEIEFWKAKILAAVGEAGYMLTELSPKLQWVIGEQTENLETDSKEAQNRLYYVSKSFLQVFVSEHPGLIIFFDDIQWADQPSVDLLQNVCQDEQLSKVLFIISEATSTERHPHSLSPFQLSASNAYLQTKQIQVLNLHKGFVRNIISDSFPGKEEDLLAVSEIIHEKTKGNPYFVRQFLENLFNEQLLVFDFHKYEWKWSIEQIRRLGITENVIDLLIKRFQQLPPQALYLIKIIAFAKTRIQTDLIPTLVSMGEVHAQEYIDLLSISGIVYTEQEEDRIMLSFIDERLRNAAQVLCSMEEKQQINLLLARCYEHVESTNENDLFLLAGYYTEAIPLLTFEAEIEKVAGIAKKAALLAKEKVAYALAEQFISTAISLVKTTVWKERYDWVLQIFNIGIEVNYMLGNYQRMEELAQEVEKNALDILDLDKVYEFRIQSHKALSNLNKSIQYGIAYLKMLDISLKENPGQIQVIFEFIKTQNILKKKTEEELLNAPFITDRRLKVTFQIYSVMSPVAYFTSSNLLAVLASKQMQIIAKYGNLPLSPYIIASLGYTYCGIIGDIDKGYYYGNLALKLLEKYNLTQSYARTQFAYNFFVRHWKEPIKNTIQPLQKAYETGLKSGDFEHAAYSLFMSFYHSFFAGTHLKELFAQGESNLLAIAGLSHRSSYFLMANMLQTVHNLSQKNSQPYLLEGKFYQAADNFPVHVEANDKPNLVTWICTQLILGYTFNHPERVFATFEQGEKYIDAGLGALGRSYILFYISLSYYEYGHTLDAPLRKKYKNLATKNRKILGNWSKSTYHTYAHKHFLVLAEEYKSKNKIAKAREYFEKALESANDSGLIPMQALCWERSARFYLSIDQTNLATHHLLQSMRLYESWGAINKKEILEKEFSSLLRKPFIPLSNDAHLPTHHTVNSMTDYAQLDMLSILKASQAISGNIRLEQLLENLMRIVLENAGAENGYLLLQERTRWMVRVKGHINTGFGKPEEDMFLDDFKGAQAPFSTTIINYVIRTRENVVLDYASQVGKFVSDPYISENRTKSLICIPLVNQGLVIAILYLENNLSTGAFTRERLEMLNMLTSQAAISIENAMLYEYLEEKVEERTEEVNRQKKELVEQSEQLKLTNLIIEKKNQDITASINYGSRIQSAMMPSINLLSHYLPETFIMFRPRDIVSGDFYWFTSHEGKIIVAAVDCTGHGVPGAFMSMIGIDLLNSIVNQKGITSPEDILNQLTLGVSNALQREDNSLRDGMDMAICTISTENGKKVVSYAGAKNPLVYVKNGEMTYIKADRVAIGDGSHQYTRHDIVIDAPTMFYLYSDGYQDQFGGPSNRKFMSNRFKELLNQISSLPSEEQKQVLEKTLDEWINDTNQLDDILVMGFRLS